MRILEGMTICLTCIATVAAISVQAVCAQPPSLSRDVPTKVSGVAVGDILQRLGAKLEQGSDSRELADYTNHFNRTDPNRDGQQTWEEYVENGVYMTPQARAGIFRAADGDADGVVTRAEYVLNRIITDEAKAIIQGMDDDKDGLVERGEFVKHAAKLLSDAELAEQVFTALDVSADGGITIPEYLRVWGQWARLGQKSAEERIAARKAELADATSEDDAADKPVKRPVRTGDGRPGGGPPRKPFIGAIRWDAWSGGGVTEVVEKTLGPKKYHHRLPWFAQVNDDGTVRIDGSRQEVMDQEIDYAAKAGLDYWAFLAYPEQSTMSTAIKQYLRSSQRARIRFCLILHNSLSVTADHWPGERDRIITLLKEPGYQTVLNGRPLVYAFTGQKFPLGRFSEVVAAAREAGLAPYYVYMGWNPASDYKRVATWGFDAVSAYAMGSDQATFQQLARKVETDYWQNAATGRVPYVTFVTTGWDKRPRKDNPVPWERDHDYLQQNTFPSLATPQQIGEHLGAAIDFTEQHRDICAANAMILYAWNEFDEGGWLAPTWTSAHQANTSRLDAIRAVLTSRQ